MTRKIKYIIPWIFVIFWMALIFNLSSQPASNSDKLSRGVTEKVIETVKKVTHKPELSIDELNHIIRKNAHFFAYLGLGILVLNALRRSGVTGGKSYFFAFLISALYAGSDEFHQMFVPGRGAMVTDVFIDSSGAALGLGIYKLVSSFAGRRKI